MPPCLTCVLMNWKRPDNIRNEILPALSQCPLIGEVILCHCHPETSFRCYSNRFRIRHRDDVANNETHGLSIRFLAAREATYPTVVLMDDDLVVHPATFYNLKTLYDQNAPCLVAKWGRNLSPSGGYSSSPIPTTQRTAPIALTCLMMVSRRLCRDLLPAPHPLQGFVEQHSTPLWNGEDIYISLRSILEYGKWPIILGDNTVSPVQPLRTPGDLEVAISSKPGHVSYRGAWIRKLVSYYGLELFTSNRRGRGNRLRNVKRTLGLHL